MKNKLSILLLTFTLILALLPLSLGAVETLKPAKLNQEYIVTQSCADATYLNISISNLNGLIGTNLGMIQNGSIWTYNFTPTSLGRYDVAGISDGCDKTFATYFEVTPSGFTGTLGFYIIFIVIIAGMFILGFVTKNNYIMMFGSIAVLFFGFFVINFGIDIIKNTQTTWAIGLITWALGIICIYISLEEQLKVWG